MKFNVKIGNIEIQGTKLENIEIGVQYTSEELVSEYGLIKTILKELPETIEELKAGAIIFDNASKEVTNHMKKGEVA